MNLASSCRVMSLDVESWNSSIFILDAGTLTDILFSAMQLIALMSAAFCGKGIALAWEVVNV